MMAQLDSPPCLVWVDVETSGLEPESHRLLEVGMIVTSTDLEELARTSLVVCQRNLPIGGMGEWCLRIHGRNGLLAEVVTSNQGESEVEQRLLHFLQQLTFMEPGQAPMCGASVHFDRAWLRHWMPRLERWFHYRNLDVSSIEALVRMWWPHVQIPKGCEEHRALPDLEDAIFKLRFFRQLLFTRSEWPVVIGGAELR